MYRVEILIKKNAFGVLFYEFGLSFKMVFPKDSIRNLVQYFYDISSKYYDVTLSAIAKGIKEIA